MQVDGAADDLEAENDEADFETNSLDTSDDSSNLSFPTSKCPICEEPTKMHKTYHLVIIFYLPLVNTEIQVDQCFLWECKNEVNG